MKRLFFFITIFCGMVLPAISQTLYTGSKGIIKFRSEARLELIDAQSDRLKAALDLQKKTFAFSVPISSFMGFNAELQREHFNEKYMESSRFPTASFIGKIIEDIQLDKNQVLQVRAKGVLSVHGVEQERIIKATISVKDGRLVIVSKFSVLLKDHAIRVPKVVHEKIATEIFVDVNAQLQK